MRRLMALGVLALAIGASLGACGRASGPPAESSSQYQIGWTEGEAAANGVSHPAPPADQACSDKAANDSPPQSDAGDWHRGCVDGFNNIAG